AALSACSESNADSMGSVTATIDGKPYSAITLSSTSSRAASATFSQIGAMVQISIQGHDLDTGDIMDNVLNLEVSLMGADASSKIYEATLMYWPQGMSKPFYTSDGVGSTVAVTWDQLSLGDAAVA